MTIGNRISELRKKYSYSQEYVASELGVTRQAVSKWETDQTSPDTNNLIALAQLFNVSVEYLAVGKTYEEQQCLENNTVNQTRKIVGYILLGVGMLTVALGLIFFKELLYFAATLILAGILCIVVKKHFWKTIICVFAVLFAIFSRFIVRSVSFATLFTIFNTVLLVLLVVVIIKIIKKVLQK